MDTNIVIWLYEGNTEILSEKARDTLEHNHLYLSPLILLELQYLKEVKRFRADPTKVLSTLHSEIGLRIHDTSLENLILKSINENWTREPFDRLIVSHAKIESAALITKDKTILKNYSKAIW